MRLGKRRELRAHLLSGGNTPLVRTWFGDEVEWRGLLSAIRTPSVDGFIAYVDVVEDPSLDGATPSQVAVSLPTKSEYTIAILADQRSMTDAEQPLLVILANGGKDPPALRVIPSALWGIENNMSLANMEWGDFVGSADDDGVLRNVE
jgi:hypothetical protein